MEGSFHRAGGPGRQVNDRTSASMSRHPGKPGPTIPVPYAPPPAPGIALAPSRREVVLSQKLNLLVDKSCVYPEDLPNVDAAINTVATMKEHTPKLAISIAARDRYYAIIVKDFNSNLNVKTLYLTFYQAIAPMNLNDVEINPVTGSLIIQIGMIRAAVNDANATDNGELRQQGSSKRSRPGEY